MPTKDENILTFTIEIPEGLTIREFKKLVRKAILHYLREEGLSENEIKNIKIKIEVTNE